VVNLRASAEKSTGKYQEIGQTEVVDRQAGRRVFGSGTVNIFNNGVGYINVLGASW
jgi:hypothetical protein